MTASQKTAGQKKIHAHSDHMPLISIRRAAIVALCLFCLTILAWVIYTNRPRGEFEVTDLSGILSLQEQSETDDSTGAPERPAAQEQENEQPGLSTTPASQTRSSDSSQRDLPFDVNVVYSPGYLIDLGGLEKLHPFDIRKYEKIHEALKSDKLLTDDQTLKPEPLTKEDLMLVHGEAYLDSLRNRKKLAGYLEAPALTLAPVSLNRAVLEPFRRASGGTLLAARMALKSGIGINIGGGYHHAKPNLGEGFCVFADVPIAIRKLQKEKQIKRAVVIDVDVHQGNGTILCLDGDNSTFTFSMHQKNIYPTPKEKGDLDVELPSGMGDAAYLKVLAKHLPSILDESDADICFIVGGCDPLAGDPLASLKMTPEGIVKRDQAIVEACVQRKIPVVLTLSGGYSPDAWKSQYMSIKNLIKQYGLFKIKNTAAEKTDAKRKSGSGGSKTESNKTESNKTEPKSNDDEVKA